MRLNANLDDLAQIRLAYLERSGDISFIKKKFDPHRSSTYETDRTHETNQKALDQTDAENRADLFRVHVLRRRGLIEGK
jgi:uncharacterized membrane protein YcaP (DUF421 family)